MIIIEIPLWQYYEDITPVNNNGNIVHFVENNFIGSFKGELSGQIA